MVSMGPGLSRRSGHRIPLTLPRFGPPTWHCYEARAENWASKRVKTSQTRQTNSWHDLKPSEFLDSDANLYIIQQYHKEKLCMRSVQVRTTHFDLHKLFACASENLNVLKTVPYQLIKKTSSTYANEEPRAKETFAFLLNTERVAFGHIDILAPSISQVLPTHTHAINLLSGIPSTICHKKTQASQQALATASPTRILCVESAGSKSLCCCLRVGAVSRNTSTRALVDW